MTFPEGPVIQRDVPLAGGQIGIIHACPSCGVGISRTDYEALRAELHQRDETIKGLRKALERIAYRVSWEGSDTERVEAMRRIARVALDWSDADLGKGE